MPAFRLGILLALLNAATNVLAAEVVYQHPNLTIVAQGEPLNSVLTSLMEEMGIQVTSPLGLNPDISSDIHNQPVKKALKNLLGELSYSLVWAEEGDRLLGLVILSDEEGSIDGANAQASSLTRRAGATGDLSEATSEQSHSLASVAIARDDGLMRADHAASRAIQREERKALREQEREERETEIAQRREQKRVAREEQRKEEVALREAEAAAYLESHGVQLRR